jgi:hypothetical protein
VTRSSPLLALFLACALTPAVAQHQHQMPMDRASLSAGQIAVTVNPEARVSAVLGDARPRQVKCGNPLPLDVRVFNQGGITAPLNVRLVGAPEYVSIHLEGPSLSGQPEENRTLHVILLRPGATDITIAFSITGDDGDLADRDRVHVLVRCTKP